jgi:protein ImuB
LRASVAIGANFHAARLKAAASRGITVIPHRQEATALAKLPLAVLDLPPEHAETFVLWGIRTLADLAAIPEIDLVTRFGAQAIAWRDLARGALPHTFQPLEAGFSLQEFCAFEAPVDRTDSLLFIGARMIDCLATRAATRALSLASLVVQMELEGGRAYQRTIRPALPTTDRKFLLKLLQLEIAAHPPQAAVLSLTLSAQAGQSSKVQLGLFAPQTPEPSRLDVTIARLKAIAGEDRVGSPVLEDTHRPGSFRMESFAVPCQSSSEASKKLRPVEGTGFSVKGTGFSPYINPAKESRALAPEGCCTGLSPGMPSSFAACVAPSSASKSNASQTARPRMALRRMRPPVPVHVQLRALKPVAFRDREQSFKVAAAYGPWRTSGCWWSTEVWNTEEWDVLAELSSGSSIACLLVHDCTHNHWQLEAFYD